MASLGGDLGFGHGWRLQAGAIAPIWNGSAFSHFVFTDSTGAEYHLTVNNNGVWSGKDCAYVYNEERAAQMAIAYDYTTGQFPNQFATFTLNKVTYPTTYTQSGPQVIAVPGAVYQYTYDSTGRPTGETRDGSAVVDQVTYNTFGAMTQMRQLVGGGSKTETRAYDSFQRLTSMTTLDGAAITYNYSQTANDGKLVSQTTVASDTYGYDPGNKRIWKNDEYTFWGANGERIGRYSAMKLVDSSNNHSFVFQKIQVDEYFGGCRLTSQDRQGSVGSYYPYGESRSGTVSNADSFATYFRDTTGLDYADQRYHLQGVGRFLTADPTEPGEVLTPRSWNYYSYVESDPINFNDPNGTDVSGLNVSFSLTPTCLERFTSLISTDPEGWFNSDVGTLAIHIYFEWRSDGTRPNDDVNIWTGIANVWRNRWHLTDQQKREYLSNGFADLTKTYGFKGMFAAYDSGEKFWESWKGKVYLKQSYVSNSDPRTPGLVQIVNSAPDSGLCNGIGQVPVSAPG
ncbi:MAG: hypothetical protein K2X03_25540 [Bryobacteraceae bacterium]|nr:hypothetical protein [Bryobacteraceae bacterium]